MATYDPVLDRPMFQSRDTKGRGIASAAINDTNTDMTSDDLKSRREQAAALIDQAKKKFDPSNFQMLSEQERPEVFRPVAVNMPAPQQTANTAQRMQQMAAQGVQQPVQQQPVQMAIGGLAAFAKGGLNRSNIEGGGDADLANGSLYQDMLEPSEKITPTIRPQNPGVVQYSLPDIGLRIGNPGEAGITTLKPTTDEKLDSRIPTPSNAEKKQYQSPATWSDSDINDIAYDMYNSKVGELHGTEAKTPIGRGLQSLNPFRSSPDYGAIVQDLKNKRDIAQNWRSGVEATALRSEQEDQVAKAMEANPVKSVFEEQTPEERTKAINAQNAAVAKAEAPFVSPPVAQPTETNISGTDTSATTAPASTPTNTSPVSSGISALTGTSGDYSISPSNAAPSAPSQTLNAYSPQTEANGPASDNTMIALNAYNAGASTSPIANGSMQQTAFPETGKTALTMEDIKARREQERQDNFNLALMQAGLAIAGGKSSNALTNIGEGGMQGVQMFAKGEQENRVLERERMADLRAQQQQEMDRAYRINELATRYAQMGLEGKKLDFEIGNAAKTLNLRQDEVNILRDKATYLTQHYGNMDAIRLQDVGRKENVALSNASEKADAAVDKWVNSNEGVQVLSAIKDSTAKQIRIEQEKKKRLNFYLPIERDKLTLSTRNNASSQDPDQLFSQ